MFHISTVVRNTIPEFLVGTPILVFVSALIGAIFLKRWVYTAVLSDMTGCLKPPHGSNRCRTRRHLLKPNASTGFSGDCSGSQGFQSTVIETQ